VFFVTFSMTGITLVMLALRLPDDVPLLRRWQWLEPICYGVGLALGVTCVAIYQLGGDTRGMQSLFSVELALGFLFFVVTFFIRYARSRGERQDILRPLFVSMVPPYAAIGVGIALSSTSFLGPFKSLVDILTYPTMLFAPLASGYAFVRHDLWGSRALLSRIGTHVVLGTVACIAAIAVAAALAGSIGLGFKDAMAGAAVSTILAIALTAVARRASDFTIFRSRAEYKPTIEQLSSELLTITSPEDVGRAIERTVKRWLACDFVRLTLQDGEEPPTASEQSSMLQHGSEDLRLQVSFAGRPLGWLEVGQKRGGALFTSEDLDLLRTMTNQGGLAIAHAKAYQELEYRRQQQAQAWRGEREALVETVAAEVAHEIRYPINYFRSVFEREARGERLDADDIDVGREEVDRLERLVAGLKRMATNRLERTPEAMADLCGRAEALLKDALGERRVVLDVEASVVVRCDSDKMIQILVNVLSNGLEAAGENGSVGVGWSEVANGAELVIWDDGPGFTGEPSRLFAPWFTTKPRGTGLGLAITHRLVRAHGWNITAQRRGTRTAFVIAVRKEDIMESSIGLARDSQEDMEVA